MTNETIQVNGSGTGGFSTRFDEALSYAAEAHRFQRRKDTKATAHSPAIPGAPYIGHLLGVASIVIDARATEDEAIGALLHDVAEDQGGEPRLREVREIFGDLVGDIVEGCSDSLTEDPEAKAPWRERKERYIEHVRTAAKVSVLLVSSADKLHNARSTLQDLRLATDPSTVWSKFNSAAGRDGTLWYYRSLIAAFRAGPRDARRDPIVDELERVVEAMAAASA